MTSSSPGDWRSSFGYGPGHQAGSLSRLPRIWGSITPLPVVLFACVGVPPARHACSSKIFGQAMSSALKSSPGNASAAAAAFMSSCAGTWSDHDLRRYLASNWKAGGPAGASCSDAQLFGDYHDGGKLVCRPRELVFIVTSSALEATAMPRSNHRFMRLLRTVLSRRTMAPS